jgi:hypothetical protein
MSKPVIHSRKIIEITQLRRWVVPLVLCELCVTWTRWVSPLALPTLRTKIRSEVFHLVDLELHHAARGFDLHHIAFHFANQAAGNR